MAVWTSPPDFISLYGLDGLGWLVGLRDNTTDVNGRKNAINWALIEVFGQVKGYWRLRASAYTSSSSPALTAGTAAYNMPSDYDAPFRLYYREAGRMQDVEIISDAEWLERSATRATDAGDPRHARVIHNGTTFRFELDRPLSQAFIDRVGTLTLEYFNRMTLLSADTDTPLVPPNLIVNLLSVAAAHYAMVQGDWPLADRLAREAELAKAKVLKYDLTRTGRPRRIRPSAAYQPSGVGHGEGDYGETR